MINNNQSSTTHLVLIGGGHSHAIALRKWGIKPLPNVKVTLITDTINTPYSGMLPGYVAGFYSYEETHIDLSLLAKFAKINLCLDKAIGIDLQKNQVICENNKPINFDYLSLDIGSTPSTVEVRGAVKYAIPAKPVPQFLKAWNQIIKQVESQPDNYLNISIVGGGAGGVELALNMHSHLDKLTNNFTINLFHSGKHLLENHNFWVGQKLENILINKGINLYLQEQVKAIEIVQKNLLQSQISKPENREHKIICESGFNKDSNWIFWVTQASAPLWIKNSGLATDKKGFILVKDTLQSLSHPHIFATGDIATMVNYSRPKAGVFAVRQGLPLFNNLQRIIVGKPLQNYRPQKLYLSLIGTGDQQAIASWGCLGFHSPLLWHWKDYLDRQFMEKFRDFRQESPHLTRYGCFILGFFPFI